MSINRTAKGIVLVPSLLLGGAFLAAGTWMEGAAAANRPLAFTLGGVLVAAGLFTQLLPESQPESQKEGATLDEREETTPPARPLRSMENVLGNPGKIDGIPGSVGRSAGSLGGSTGKKDGNASNPGGLATNDGGGAQRS